MEVTNIDVELFEDRYATSQYARFSKQIYSKKGTIDGPFDEFLKIQSDNPLFQKYREVVLMNNGKERVSLSAGKLTADNLYEVELLGISRYRRLYMTLVDFTDIFDFIIACLSGCDIFALHKMSDYHEVSKAITHFSFGYTEDTKFSELTDVDKKVESWLYKLFLHSVHFVYAKDYKLEAQRLLCVFYEEVTKVLEDIKDYTAVYLTGQLQAVYRSKSFYSIILTSNIPINGTITLKRNGYEKVVPIRSYLPLEFPKALAKGEVSYEPIVLKYKNAIVVNKSLSVEEGVYV